MRMKAYLRVVSDHKTIVSLHKQTSIHDAQVAQLKAACEGSDDFWWNWQTPAVELDAADMDQGVRALLNNYRSKFPIIKAYGAVADVYLEIVSYYKPVDRPEGLYLSRETISLLGELGAALDNDAICDLLPEPQYLKH